MKTADPHAVASKRFLDALKARAGAEWKLWNAEQENIIETSGFEVERLAKELDAVIRKSETVETVPALMRAIASHAKKVAPTVATMKKLARAVDEVGSDPAFVRDCGDYVVDLTTQVADDLEAARQALQTAQQALERGQAYLAARAGNADDAAEAWSEAVFAFEAVADDAEAEAKAWGRWYADAVAAHKARDAARLEKIRRAPPSMKALRTLWGWPRGNPFQVFDAEVKADRLPKALRERIARERAAAVERCRRVQAQAMGVPLAEKKVGEMAIEPIDSRKGLAVLGLPAAALPKLRKALEVPVAERIRALDGLARALKLSLDGRTIVARLEKAGVL